MKPKRLPKMRRALFAAAFSMIAVSAESQAASIGYEDPLSDAVRTAIRSQFGKLMDLANRHNLQALHAMFWRSPAALLVAKSADATEGNWAGYWGNAAIDEKLHDIAASGPVVLRPDYSKLRVVGLTRQVAESYAPLDITVSYAGQDGTPRPFLLIIDWIKVGKLWKVAAEIILPVPPTLPKGEAAAQD